MQECGLGRWVTRYSARGYPYDVWEPPMPRIRDEYLNCVIYLYRSRHEAEEGINIGGSGFIVTMPCERLPPPAAFVYAVTNKHVIENNACCIRFNTVDGRLDVMEFNRSDWSIAQNDDLAVLAVPSITAGRYLIRAMSVTQFLTEEMAARCNVGPGDEVAVIGRFINQEGKQKNIPTVRFGFISQKASEPVEYEGIAQESYLCEVKSIGGFSGSPVILAADWRAPREGETLPPHWSPLLGVDWAHIQNWEPAQDKHGVELDNILYPINTGMMAVVPAWKLEALLKSPNLVNNRKEMEDREIARRAAPKVALDVAGVAVPSATDEHPMGRERFTALLNAAVKTPAPKD